MSQLVKLKVQLNYNLKFELFSTKIKNLNSSTS